MRRFLGLTLALGLASISGCCAEEAEIKVGKGGTFQGYDVECRERITDNEFSKKVIVRDGNDEDKYKQPLLIGYSDTLLNGGEQIWTNLELAYVPTDHPFRELATLETLDAAYKACWKTNTLGE